MKSWYLRLMMGGYVVIFIFIIFLILRSSPVESSDVLWEEVLTPRSSARMMRTPTPHGWLVAYKRLARSFIYIPDEKHEWDINVTKKIG